MIPKDKLGREISKGDICVIATSKEPYVFGKVFSVNIWNSSVYYTKYDIQNNVTLEILLKGTTNNHLTSCLKPNSRLLILKRARKEGLHV